MATRIYFPSDYPNIVTPPVTPEFDAAWEDISAAIQSFFSPTKQNTTLSPIIGTKTEAGAPYDVLMAQFISDPLDAQTISGTVKGQFQVWESTIDFRLCRALVIKVVDYLGTTVKGILLSHFPSLISEWDYSALTNRYFPPDSTALSELTVEIGDRLVIEIGFRSWNTDDYQMGEIKLGDPTGGDDLPEDETTTTAKAPWVEFSQTLNFFTGTIIAPTGIPLWPGWEPGQDQVGYPVVILGSAPSPGSQVTAWGGIELGGAGVMAFLTPTVYAQVGSGGLELSGEGITPYPPPPVPFIRDGGLVLGGRGIIRWVTPGPPTTYAMVGSGGLKLGGTGLPKLLPQVTQYDVALVGSGGLEIGGAGIQNFVTPPVYAMVGSGSLVLGEFRVPELTVCKFVQPGDLVYAVVASGGLVVGGEGIFGFSKPPVYAMPGRQAGEPASLLLGGAGCMAFITPQVLNLVGSGELVMEGAAEEEGIFDTLVLTGFRNEPSLYSNFPFNSYAKFRDKYYGANQTGIYLLEGEDDAGEEIHPGVRIGPTNFGTQRQKRLRVLRCGGDNEGARVKVSSNGSAAYADLEENRAMIPHNVQGREITVEITDFETLDHLELIPHVLVKR
jgi:hypothetical protein